MCVGTEPPAKQMQQDKDCNAHADDGEEDLDSHRKAGANDLIVAFYRVLWGGLGRHI